MGSRINVVTALRASVCPAQTPQTIQPNRSRADLPPRQLFLPLVHQRPIHRASSEIGQVSVRLQSCHRCLDHPVVLPENRPVRGQQVLYVRVPDSFQARDEFRQVRTVMGIDHTHAAISKDVVPAEQQMAHS